MADRCPLPPWLILHIPHASRYIPNEVRQALCVDAAEFEREQDRLVDHYTDKLFHLRSTLVARCKAKVSRFAVDVERYEEDEHEPMSSIGMGAIYTHTTDGSPLRTPPTAAQRQQLLDAYYRPHHARLLALVEAALAAHERAVIIDCHSFPSTPLPCDLDQAPERPDICLGTDPNHTPQSLCTSLARSCAEVGWSVAFDRPYSGTMIPTPYYGRDPRVTSVMIEVNRRLYLQNEPHDITPDDNTWASVQTGVAKLLYAAFEWGRINAAR